MERKFFGLVLLLILVLSSQDKAMKSEATNSDCEVKSTTFKGICIKKEACVTACLEDGYGDGKCSTFLRRCMCIEPCNNP
ncbi:hypothetical protein UlMin_024933 [Ulmus minor]